MDPTKVKLSPRIIPLQPDLHADAAERIDSSTRESSLGDQSTNDEKPLPIFRGSSSPEDLLKGMTIEPPELEDDEESFNSDADEEADSEEEDEERHEFGSNDFIRKHHLLILVLSVVVFSLMMAMYRESSSSHPVIKNMVFPSTVVPWLFDLHRLHTSILEISITPQDKSESMVRGDIHLLGATLHWDPTVPYNLPSKFIEYRDSYRALSLGVIGLKSSCRNVMREMQDVDPNNPTYLLQGIHSHLNRLDSQIFDVINSATKVTNVAFDALVGLGTGHGMITGTVDDPRTTLTGRDKNILRAIDHAHTTFDVVRKARIELLDLKSNCSSLRTEFSKIFVENLLENRVKISVEERDRRELERLKMIIEL